MNEKKIDTGVAAFIHPKFNVDFESSIWKFTYDLAGSQSQSITVDWNFELGAGDTFGNPKHWRLLAEMKAFLKAAIIEDNAGIRMQVGSIVSTFMGIRELVKFMCTRRVASVSSMDAALSWEFVEELEDQYIQGGDDLGRERAWTHAAAYKLLHPLTQMYELSRVLGSGKIVGPCEAPYDGKTTYSVVLDALGLTKAERLAPIPDLVAIPTLSEAQEWVEHGADDLICLLEDIMPRLEASRRCTGRARVIALAEIREKIESFKMGINPRTGEPWHGALLPYERVTDEGEWGISGLQALRRAVLNLQSACASLIQGCTGIRGHELMGLMVSDSKRLFGGVVEISTSEDGLMDVFSIVGISAKRQESRHFWTAGFRPVGTSYLPLPVVAIDVLCRLLSYWRNLSGRRNLLLTFTSAKSIPTEASGVGRMTVYRNSLMQREFAANALVKRSNMSIDEALQVVRSIRPQRWRTTFAHFVYRTQPSLITSLRDHFRHMSEQITDQGYIGNDPELLVDLEGERVLETGRLFAEISLGRHLFAGPAASLVKKHADSLSQSINEMDGETRLEKAVALVEAADIRIWTGAYASCLINIFPHNSSCNAEASIIPASARPNFGIRSPSLCATCKCCVILPEHKEFWKERQAFNEALVSEESVTSARSGERTIAAHRAAQSRSIVARLEKANEGAFDDPGGTPPLSRN